MPLLKNAKKKQRQDELRTEKNRSAKNLFRDLVKKARLSGKEEEITKAVQGIDKAAKNNLIHKNKAARIKSSLSKLTADTAGTKLKTLRQSKAKKIAVKAQAQAKRQKTVSKKIDSTTTKTRKKKK